MSGFMDSVRNMGTPNQNNQNNQNQNNNDNNSNNNDNNNNNDDNNNSNNQNNVDNIKSIWDNSTNETENNDQNNNNQNVNTNQQQNIDPSEVFNQHIASLNLSDGIDLSNLQAEAAEGNFESINKAFDTIAANTYKAALQSMNKLVDSKMESIVEKAVSESSNVINETTAIKEMHSALSFADDKDIAPVAEAAMKQFMSQGASVNEAIQKVGQFFQTTAEKVGGMNSSQNNPGSGGFNPNSNVNNSNNSNNNNNSNQDEESWMDFLTNK